MSRNNFADYLHQRIQEKDSVLCAGLDPQLTSFPGDILDEARKNSNTDADYIYHALMRFYGEALEVIAEDVACIKPNIAFFEQYGLGALRALQELSAKAREQGIPVILDVKRGDISSTAEAYAAAYFGGKEDSAVPGLLNVDAITVSPYMGFDSIEPYLPFCKERGKGLFVLVQTSNPGGKDLQGIRDSSAIPVTQHVADWLAREGDRYVGRCGFSSLGAVVGAPYPRDARTLRTIMARQCVLIPGYGAQGGSAADAVQSLDNRGLGGVINSSRGIFGGLQDHRSTDAMIEIEHRVIRSKQQLNKARIENP